MHLWPDFIPFNFRARKWKIQRLNRIIRMTISNQRANNITWGEKSTQKTGRKRNSHRSISGRMWLKNCVRSLASHIFGLRATFFSTHSQTHTHTSIVIVFMAGQMMCFSSNRVIETFKCHTHSNVINVLQWSIHTNGVVVVLANSSFTSAFCVLSSIALAKCLKWVWLTCSDDGGSEQFGTDSISKDSRSIDAIIIPIAINTYWILTRAISRASVFPMHAPNGLHVSVLLTHLKRFSNFGWTKSNNKKASGEMKKAKTFDFIIFLRF